MKATVISCMQGDEGITSADFVGATIEATKLKATLVPDGADMSDTAYVLTDVKVFEGEEPVDQNESNREKIEVEK